MISNPGWMATWGYRRKYGPPARDIPLQVGRVGSTPKPRKLKLASAVIARARLGIARPRPPACADAIAALHHDDPFHLFAGAVELDFVVVRGGGTIVNWLKNELR